MSEPTTHHYLSTACQHAAIDSEPALHLSCRQVCKYGHGRCWCQCACHEQESGDQPTGGKVHVPEGVTREDHAHKHAHKLDREHANEQAADLRDQIKAAIDEAVEGDDPLCLCGSATCDGRLDLANAITDTVMPIVQRIADERDELKAESVSERKRADRAAANTVRAWERIEKFAEQHIRWRRLGDPGPGVCADWCHLCRVERLEAELVAARSQLDRVRAIHRRDGRGFCIECTDAGVIPWPCDTIAALDRAEDA